MCIFSGRASGRSPHACVLGCSFLSGEATRVSQVMLNFFSGTTYATHSYVFSGLRSGCKPEVRVGRWVRDLRFAMCFPGLCRDSSSAVVAETRMARRATFDLLVELGPRVRRPRTLEPGRAHRRRLSLRRMHARCASPASRSFKPWVRVPMPRQETRFGKSQCVRGGGYLQMADSARQ